MNWQTIGMTDGAKGGLPSKLNEYSEICSKYSAEIDRTLYDQGYQKGIAQYCTKANGFEVGIKGDEYFNVCPADVENNFLSGFNAGHELWTAKDKIQSAEKRRLVAVVRTLGPDIRHDRQSREIETLRLSEQQRKQVLDGTDGPHFGTGVGPREYEYASRVAKIDRLISECVEVQERVAALGFDVEDACN